MVIIVFLLLLIPELYVWWFFLRNFSWIWQVAFFLPYIAIFTLMTLVQTPLYQAWMFRCAMILMLCYLIPQILFMIISGIGWLLHFFVPSAWRVMNILGLAIVITLVGIVGYGLSIGWKKLVVTKVDLEFKDLPKGFDGYRIVQLSDFHIGTYEPAPECVTRIVNEVNALNPDIICFTGDLVNSSPEELNPFMQILPKMKAKDGVFSIMGNHDYCMYAKYNKPEDRIKTIKDLQNRERSFGWDLLLNENRIIYHNGDSLMLAGVENSSKPPFPDYGDLNKAIGNSTTPFKILLSHDPTHWRRKVLNDTDVQLQLSGHTHSTQFRLFGWSPASFTYKEYAGLYEITKDGKESFNPKISTSDTRKLYVCTGTGGNVSFRFGVWPEIVLITLHKAK